MTDERSTASPAAETRAGPLHVATFDGFRGFVVLFIALSHCALLSGWPRQGDDDVALALFNSSSSGLEFLFAISGFVLFLPVAANRRLEVRSYVIRRVGRILPAYYVSVVLSLLIAFVIDTDPGEPPFGLGSRDLGVILSHLAFLQQELYPEAVGFGVNPIIWSMSPLVICYLALPLVALWYLRHPVLGLAVAVAASSGWRLAFESFQENEAFLQGPALMTAFALGMSAAFLYVWLHRRIGAITLRPFAMTVFALAGAALVGVVYLNGHGVVEGDWPKYAEPIALTIAIPAAFLAVVVSSAFAGRWVQWPFANRGSRWLGDVSYGVFLFHGPVAVLATEVEPGVYQQFTLGAMLQLTAMVVPATLIVAWLSLAFLERPLRDRARAIARRYETRPETVAREPAAVPAMAGQTGGGR